MLASFGVDTVAMESTGVYWTPLFERLESRGLKVYLVNARHVKNRSGPKSDGLDCQWLQQLMTFVLLAGAFQPAEQICVLRAINAGERDGRVLASLRNARIKASEEEIAKSLVGTWRAEHLFALRQALAGFDFIGTQLAEVGQELEARLKVVQSHDGEPPDRGRKGGRADLCDKCFGAKGMGVGSP